MIEFISYHSGSKGNLYQISNGKTSLLLDPGIPIAQIKKVLNFKLSEISGALCGHEHADHSKGIAGLMEVGIDVYTGNSTIEALGLNGHRLHLIQHLKQFFIGSFKILPFSIPHDVPCLAFLFQSNNNKFLFLIDCLYCPYKFSGLTGIAIGINYDSDILRQNIQAGYLDPALGRRIIANHLSLSTALDFFKAQDLSKVEAIHVLHCSESNLDKKKAEKEIQKLTGKLVIIED